MSRKRLISKKKSPSYKKRKNRSKKIKRKSIKSIPYIKKSLKKRKSKKIKKNDNGRKRKIEETEEEKAAKSMKDLEKSIDVIFPSTKVEKYIEIREFGKSDTLCKVPFSSGETTFKDIRNHINNNCEELKGKHSISYFPQALKSLIHKKEKETVDFLEKKTIPL